MFFFCLSFSSARLRFQRRFIAFSADAPLNCPLSTHSSSPFPRHPICNEAVLLFRQCRPAFALPEDILSDKLKLVFFEPIKASPESDGHLPPELTVRRTISPCGLVFSALTPQDSQFSSGVEVPRKTTFDGVLLPPCYFSSPSPFALR